MATNLFILIVALALLWLAVVGDLGCFARAYNDCVSKGGAGRKPGGTSGPIRLTPS